MGLSLWTSPAKTAKVDFFINPPYLHAKDLVLPYSITEDQLGDLGTKRLARKKLARFAIIFFNCLANNWKDDHEKLARICGPGVFLELD